MVKTIVQMALFWQASECQTNCYGRRFGKMGYFLVTYAKS